MDPFSIVGGAITVGTLVKDVVVLVRAIQQSIEKVRLLMLPTAAH